MNKNLQEIKKINNFEDIEGNYDALICDVWGVIHNGRELFEGVNDCLVNFRSKQKPVVLLSNAPRPSKNIERMLNQLGLDRKLLDDGSDAEHQQQDDNSPLNLDSSSWMKTVISKTIFGE